MDRNPSSDDRDSSNSSEAVRAWMPVRLTARRKKILVIKLDHLGDFIMAVPAMRDLRDLFPMDEIILVCGSWNKPLAERLRLFDEIRVYNYFTADAAKWDGVPVQSLREFQAITQGRYDIAIDLRCDTDTRPMLSLVEATAKCGIGGEYEFPYLNICLPIKNLVSRSTVSNNLWHVFRASDFTSNVLSPTPLYWEIDFTKKDYCLIFGPYATLPTGNFRATFHFNVSGIWAFGLLCRIKIDVGQRIQPITSLQRQNQHLRAGRATLEFTNSDDQGPIEFRIYARGRPIAGNFRFFGVTLEYTWIDPNASSNRWSRQLHRGEYLSLLVKFAAERLDPSVEVRVDEISGVPSAGIGRALGHQRAIYVAPLSNSRIRNWPLESYVALIRMILDRINRPVVLLGTKDQRAAMTEIECAVGNSHLTNLTGKTRWTELPELFENAELVVCNNSGVAHLAAASGATVLAIYSGSHTPEEWGPRGNGRILALSANAPCSPCGYDDIKRCTHAHRCMTAISPDIVFEKIRMLLERSPHRDIGEVN